MSISVIPYYLTDSTSQCFPLNPLLYRFSGGMTLIFGSHCVPYASTTLSLWWWWYMSFHYQPQSPLSYDGTSRNFVLFSHWITSHIVVIQLFLLLNKHHKCGTHFLMLDTIQYNAIHYNTLQFNDITNLIPIFRWWIKYNTIQYNAIIWQ